MRIRNATGGGALTTGNGILVVDAINGATTARLAGAARGNSPPFEFDINVPETSCQHGRRGTLPRHTAVQHRTALGTLAEGAMLRSANLTLADPNSEKVLGGSPPSRLAPQSHPLRKIRH
jgi:hypothetical protein